jgi:D-arabinose 1-dehydrogenase-like Zn-dependent alcohol dehydrogenase
MVAGFYMKHWLRCQRQSRGNDRKTFPLDDIADAYEKMASGKVRFRAVITA